MQYTMYQNKVNESVTSSCVYTIGCIVCVVDRQSHNYDGKIEIAALQSCAHDDKDF